MGYQAELFSHQMLTTPSTLPLLTSMLFHIRELSVYVFVCLDRALDVSMLYGGPAHVKLIAEWEPEVKARVFGVVEDEVPKPHESVLELRQFYLQPLSATLDDCLKIYTKEETVMTNTYYSDVVLIVNYLYSSTVRTHGSVLIVSTNSKMPPRR